MSQDVGMEARYINPISTPWDTFEVLRGDKTNIQLKG
jgi:hypothetical protein